MKKKLLILLTLMFFAPFVVNAYEVKQVWEKSLRISQKNDYIPGDLFQTQDGGFIKLVNAVSTYIEGLPNIGFLDVLIIKYDKDGNLMWHKSWGGNSYEYIEGLLKTEDGGFIAYGRSNSTDIEGLPNKGSFDAIILKYDKDGNLLWQKSWGGNGSDGFTSVISTEDGGFIVYGDFNSTDIDGLSYKGQDDAIILKYDKDGNLLWQKNWGGNNYDYFNAIALTEGDEIVVAASSSSTDIEGLTNKGYYDAIILKYDKDGNLMWQNSWGGYDFDEFSRVFQTEDGGFIAYGYFESTDIDGLSNKGVYDAIIVKYDSEGNMVWQKSWAGNDEDDIDGILKTEDEGFIVYSSSTSTDIDGFTNKGDRDAIIEKYDKDGNLVWQKSWGGNSYDRFSSVFQTEDGGFIANCISASTDIEGLPNKGDRDAIIVKYDKDGNLMWQKSWGRKNDDQFYRLFQTNDGGFIALGYSYLIDIGAEKTYVDAMVVKFSIDYILENITTENGTSVAKQQGKYGIITPTPNEGYEVDKIIVKDTAGNEIEVTKLEDGTYSFGLYDDVTVEVLFKEIIENPKTGVSSIIGLLFTITLCFISGLFILRKYNERYEF